MKIFIRFFNPDINSKSGQPLPEGAPRRGTPEWTDFENILGACIRDLGHDRHWQLENPLFEDHHLPFDKRIYVHKCKRDVPQGDLFYMQLHLRNLFTIDSQGWGADHSGNDLFHPDIEIEGDSVEFCKKLSDNLWSSKVSKCDQPSETSDTPSVPFILVPIQIPRDYTIKWHSPITVKYFIDSIQAWAEETHNHVCFKLHPFNKFDYDLQQSVEDSLTSFYCHKVEGNIHELIRRSSGLFVINSGTGFESLIHGKPVATFGNCDYNKVTLNADIRRLEEARNFIYSYTESQCELAYRYVHWYCTQHSYDVHASSTPYRLTTYLKGVLK